MDGYLVGIQQVDPETNEFKPLSGESDVIQEAGDIDTIMAVVRTAVLQHPDVIDFDITITNRKLVEERGL